MAPEKPSSKQVQILAVGSGLERAGVAGRNLGEVLTAFKKSTLKYSVKLRCREMGTLYPVDRNVNQYSHCANSMKVSQKTKRRSTTHPAIYL